MLVEKVGPAEIVTTPGRLRRFLDSDIGWSFCHTPVAWLSALVLALLVLSALFAPLIAPYDPLAQSLGVLFQG